MGRAFLPTPYLRKRFGGTSFLHPLKTGGWPPPVQGSEALYPAPKEQPPLLRIPLPRSRPVLPLRIDAERIANETNLGHPVRLKKYFDNVETVKNRHPPILPPVQFPQVKLRGAHQPRPLHRIDRLGRLPMQNIASCLHLDEGERLAVPADEVDLVPVDLQIAQQDLEPVPLQMPRGDLFPVLPQEARILRLKEGGLRRRPVRRGKKSGDESA